MGHDFWEQVVIGENNREKLSGYLSIGLPHKCQRSAGKSCSFSFCVAHLCKKKKSTELSRDFFPFPFLPKDCVVNCHPFFCFYFLFSQLKDQLPHYALSLPPSPLSCLLRLCYLRSVLLYGIFILLLLPFLTVSVLFSSLPPTRLRTAFPNYLIRVYYLISQQVSLREEELRLMKKDANKGGGRTSNETCKKWEKVKLEATGA